MKTLFIHIGTPKTGTSAIQQFLRLNGERLKKDGIIYKQMPYEDFSRETHRVNKEGKLIVEKAQGRPSMTRNGFFLHGKVYGPYKEENEARLSEGLELVSNWFQEGEKAILTDEHIWMSYELWDFPKRIKEFADEKKITVKLIVFLRPQYDFLDSHYREGVKTHYRTQTFQEYLEEKALLEKVMAIDYYKRVEEMAALFGKDNILVVPYEPSQWKAKGENIFSVFMKQLDVSDLLDYKLPGKPANESLSYNQTEIMRILNNLVDPNVPFAYKTNRMFYKTGLSCTELLPEGKKQAFLTEEDQNKLMDSFASGNERLAKEYVGREQFFETSFQAREQWKKEPLSMQEDMVLFFGEVTRQLYNEILELKKDNEELSKYSFGNKMHRFFSRFRRKRKE